MRGVEHYGDIGLVWCARAGAAAGIACLFATLGATQADENRDATSTDGVCAEVTYVDTSRFPIVRVFVSLVGPQVEPGDEALLADVSVLENGRPVARGAVAGGHRISAVLVLDSSSSMDGEKLQRTKEAADAFVEAAPPRFETACVRFAADATVVSRFGESRTSLRDAIGGLSAGGATALQDGIGLALDLLRDRGKRRVVVLLTDGLENASARYSRESGGRDRLIRRAEAEGDSIFVVGLGPDVDAAYLRRVACAGGTFLAVSTPRELRGAFARIAELLARECIVEYTSPSTQAAFDALHVAATVRTDEPPKPEPSASPATDALLNVDAALGPRGGELLLLLVAPALIALVVRAGDRMLRIQLGRSRRRP